MGKIFGSPVTKIVVGVITILGALGDIILAKVEMDEEKIETSKETE
jgi:hypothetical protein